MNANASCNILQCLTVQVALGDGRTCKLFVSRRGVAQGTASDVCRFTFLRPMLIAGAESPLQQADIGPCPEADSVDFLYPKFKAAWAHQRAAAKERGQPQSASLAKALLATVGWGNVISALLYTLLAAALQFTSPLLLEQLVKHYTNEHQLSTLQLWLAVVGMLLGPVSSSILLARHNVLATRAGIAAKTVLSVAIYDKALSMGVSAGTDTGSVVTRMSVDAETMRQFAMFAAFVLTAPLQIVVALVLVYQQVQASMFLGLAFLVGVMPISVLVFVVLKRARDAALSVAEQRVKLMNEILQGVRVLKYYAWELAFGDAVRRLREAEMSHIAMGAYSAAVGFSAVLLSTPIMLPVVVFAAYTNFNNGGIATAMSVATVQGTVAPSGVEYELLASSTSLPTDGVLTAARAFTVISLLALLRFPFAFLPLGLQQWIQARISLRRIQELLSAPDVQGPDAPLGGSEHPMALVADDATFKWEDPVKLAPSRGKAAAAAGARGAAAAAASQAAPAETDVAEPAPQDDTPAVQGPILEHVNLSIKRGELIAVVGSVGAGKSSLCAALLGELQRTNGSVHVNGTVAYAGQQAWILNDTVKGNVLFGRDFDAARYAGVVYSSALAADMAQLPNGDMSEVGERGINLSGGQKARISLARAVYFDADIVLLDDPLSAVDAHVGKHLFQMCIRGKDGPSAAEEPHIKLPPGVQPVDLTGKTRVLVTNALNVLPMCDRVVVLEPPKRRQAAAGAEIVSAPSSVQATTNPTQATADTGLGAARIRMVGTYAEVVAAGALSDLQLQSLDDASDSGEEDATQEGTDVGDIVLSDAGAASSTDAVPHMRARSSSAHSAQSAGDVAEKKPAHGLTTKEERSLGRVSWDVYKYYFAAGGWLSVVMVLLTGAIGRAGELAGPFWIAKWSDDFTEAEDDAKATAASAAFAAAQAVVGTNLSSAAVGTQFTASSLGEQRVQFDVDEYLNIYVLLGIGSIIFVTIRAVFIATARLRASALLHNWLLDNVLRAPSSFFDATPVGRVLNRFSADLSKVDNELGASLSQALGTAFNVGGSMLAIAVSTSGTFIALLLPVMMAYYYIQSWYRRTSTELQRLESVSRSPIYSSFASALNGVSTIRAYGVQSRFKAKHATRVDVNNATQVASTFTQQWLAVRLDMLGALVTFFIAAVGAVGDDFVPTGWVAVALTLSSSELTGFLKHMVRMIAVVEAQMNSVERLKTYCEDIPQEAHMLLPLPTAQGSSAAADGSAAQWPTVGQVAFEGVKLRYGQWYDGASKAPAAPQVAMPADAAAVAMPLPDTVVDRRGPEVLKGVSFSVAGGETVGVVGRTGAGKSSLMVALFRMVELSGGRILIDCQDIAKVGLRHLRRAVSIIPQDPVLFSTSLRRNLDPFDEFSDEEVSGALALVGLSVEEKYPLHHPVAEGGGNLSVGERQLCCIARALLRKPKLLVLDEATASIDGASDARIQDMIRANFQGATVLTIAHRLHTIADYDRVLVLADGAVAEFDAPAALLRNGGMFADMVQSLGEQAARELTAVANKAEKSS